MYTQYAVLFIQSLVFLALMVLSWSGARAFENKQTRTVTTGLAILAAGVVSGLLASTVSRPVAFPVTGSTMWSAGIVLWVSGVLIATEGLRRSGLRCSQKHNQLKGSLSELTEQLQTTKAALDEQEQQSHYLVAHDPLTGFGNRAALTDRIEDLLVQARRSDNPVMFAVLFVDLDRFKMVNDSLGHDAGDQVLRTVAARISATVRDSDYVFRQGGDEFVVLSTNLHKEVDAARVAEKLRAEIRRPYRVQDTTVTIGVSIGIAVFPKDGEAVPTLIRNADLAMYEAKRAHGGHRFFKSRLNQYVQERLDVERDLGRAITDNQLLLNYQPIVDSSGTVVSVEALVRWQHPSRGLLMPSVFIPIAEETGQIVALGRVVLQKAISDLARWQVTTLQPLSVSVNISVEQLEQNLFTIELEQMCASEGVDPSDIMLEITETGAATHESLVRKRVKELREAGFTMAIDDFGVGYSSLSLLRELPVHFVKLDRSLLNVNGNGEEALLPGDGVDSRGSENGLAPQVESQAVEPQAIEPQAIEPQAVEPQAVETPRRSTIPTEAPSKMATDLVAGVIQILDHLGKSSVIEGIETDCQARELQRFSGAYRQGFFYGRPVSSEEIQRIIAGTA